MEFSEILKKRRSIRFYRPEPLEKQQLEALLSAAVLSPSAANRQPLRYFAVSTPELAEKIFAETAWGGHVKPRRSPVWGENAPPAFILICAKKGTQGEYLTASVDAGAAIQTMLLKAVELGFGGCWLGAINRAEIARIVGLNDDMEILYAAAFGYPAEEPEAEEIRRNDPTPYYLDEKNVLHVPKYTVEAVTEFF